MSKSAAFHIKKSHYPSLLRCFHAQIATKVTTQRNYSNVPPPKKNIHLCFYSEFHAVDDHVYERNEHRHHRHEFQFAGRQADGQLKKGLRQRLEQRFRNVPQACVERNVRGRVSVDAHVPFLNLFFGKKNAKQEGVIKSQHEPQERNTDRNLACCAMHLPLSRYTISPGKKDQVCGDH